MLIEIFSDTICPWCFIGKRKLETALASYPPFKDRQDAFDILWRPYQLNPDMPPEGMDRQIYLSSKFGSELRARQIYDNIRQVSELAGLKLDFERITRTPSTLDSHRLIRWARGPGVQNDVVEALFESYFIKGLDISDHEVLCAIAEQCGMDAGLVRELLERDDDRNQIRAEDAQARRLGINGVPCFIIDRKYAISGAQQPPVFHKVFDLARAEKMVPDLQER